MRRLLFLLLSLIAYLYSYGQDLAVESFRLLENDLTANTRGTMKYDQNGDVSALIKVVTTENDFNFNVGSLGVVATSQQKGEIWVYVPGGVQRITISHSKLGVLRDYYFPVPIEKGRTYELKLVSGRIRTIIQEEVAAQFVTFSVEPKNAIVTIDKNQYSLQADGTISQLLPYGKHSFSIDAPGFFSENGEVEVGRERIYREITLKSSRGTVTLECEMKEADIWVNGQYKGSGTWTGELDPALYQVEVRREGYTTLTTSFSIQTMEEKYISLPVPLPIYGTISVTSQPNGATVYVDEVEMGTTPLLKGDILIGHHKVDFVKKDYQTISMDIDVKEGELTSFSAEMTDVFTVSINTEPSGARLTINDEIKGYTPYSGIITSGDYSLSLEKTGYSPYNKIVHLDASNPTITAKLEQKILSKNNVYFASNYQMGHISGIEAINFGIYLAGCNIEAGYFFPISATKVYWSKESISVYLRQAYSFDLGYGFLLGNHIRITPRVGFLDYIIEDDYVNEKIMSSFVLSGSASMRFEYAPLRNIGIICTPVYEKTINIGAYAKQFDEDTNAITNWCSGFSLQIGIELIFDGQR